MNGGLWCSPVANTSSPTSSAFFAIATVALIRSCSLGVRPVVGSAVRSPTVKIPNCMVCSSTDGSRCNHLNRGEALGIPAASVGWPPVGRSDARRHPGPHEGTEQGGGQRSGGGQVDRARPEEALTEVTAGLPEPAGLDGVLHALG